MKKLLGISLVAMMAVSTANAQIASKAYVDSGAGNYITAENTAGENIKALDTQLKINTDKLPEGTTTVAQAIATALQDVNASNALQTVTANSDAGVVTNIAKDGTAVTMTKAKVTGSDIADNAGIAATQLASGVQTSLGYADDWNTTKATYGDIVTHDADEFATAAQGTFAGTAAQLSDSHFVAADKTSAATAANAAMTAAAAAQTTANAAIPAPSDACADATNKCVLTSAGAGNYAWEVIARADNGQ